MCELEKSSDNLPNDFSDNLENRNQFLKHYNQLKSLSLLQSARQNEMPNFGSFTQLQQQQQKFFEHVTAGKQVNSGGLKNIFAVNNNNVIFSDKDVVARPDSTAHGGGEKGGYRLQEGGEQRRRERNFQVGDI